MCKHNNNNNSNNNNSQDLLTKLIINLEFKEK